MVVLIPLLVFALFVIGHLVDLFCFSLGFSQHFHCEILDIFDCHLVEWFDSRLSAHRKFHESAHSDDYCGFANFVPELL